MSSPEDPQKKRERGRRYRAEKGADPAWRAKERERSRASWAKRREAVRQQRLAVAHTLRTHQAHGPTATEALAAIWEQQEGRCYLCGKPMDRKLAVIDHDHTCCPPGKSCAACRRGFACQRCNLLIGMVDDDADLLRRIADNLEAALNAARARIASKPVQLEMQDGATP